VRKKDVTLPYKPIKGVLSRPVFVESVTVWKELGINIWRGGFWPFAPIQSSQIVGYQIAALRHIADGRPAVSRIGTNGQKRTSLV
jgi:hypothetical protein